MIFINPKTDFAFKKIFGSQQSKGILISFLNVTLYKGNPTIEDLKILNPYLAPEYAALKIPTQHLYLAVQRIRNYGLTHS